MANNTISFIHLSAWYIMVFFFFLSFHINAHNGGSRLSSACRPVTATFNPDCLSLSLPRPPLFLPPRWQAKRWSATNARSASSACASPKKSTVAPASTASAVWGKQVRSPRFQKSPHATFCSKTARHYATTPTVAKTTGFFPLRVIPDFTPHPSNWNNPHTKC